MDLPVTDGAFLKQHVPWESHKRGKNWMAVVSRDPASPGGLSRRFVARAHGPYAYMAETVEAGSVIEFGADYYTTGGRPVRRRSYYLLTQCLATLWKLEEYETASKAFAAQGNLGATSVAVTRRITLEEEVPSGQAAV